MTQSCCRGRQGIVAGSLERAILPKRAAVLFVIMWLHGCATQGAMAIKDVPADYLAPPAKLVKTLDLTKLARPTEAQNRLLPGDVLEVTCANLFEESSRETRESETFPVRVAADGTVCLPLLPERVRVTSLTVGEAEQVMRNAYRAAELIRRPLLTVKILEYKKNKIYVIGAVKKAGMYELRPDHCDPLRAIAAAEGLSEEAGTVVEIRRGLKRTLQMTASAASTKEQITNAVYQPVPSGSRSQPDMGNVAPEPAKKESIPRKPGAFPVWKPDSSTPPKEPKTSAKPWWRFWS